MTAAQDAAATDSVPRRIDRLDWLMLVLALASVGLLAFDAWGHPSPTQSLWIQRGDLAVCAIFAVEFLWRWSTAGWRAAYPLRNWYDVLGMIPLAHPALRGFRLFRVVRIVVLLSRFGMAADRALGEEFTYRLVNRLKQPLVDAVSGAVTLAVLDEVVEVLERGTYTRNVAHALDENQSELRRMMVEKLRQNPSTGRLKRVPFYDEIVASVVDAALQVAQDVLRDPRTDELVADILRENVVQLREAVRLNQAGPHASSAIARGATATVSKTAAGAALPL